MSNVTFKPAAQIIPAQWTKGVRGANPEISHVTDSDAEGVMARLDVVITGDGVPEFIVRNRRLKKFEAIRKMAKSHLNISNQKLDTAHNFTDQFRDGSIWIVAAASSIPADRELEATQMISQFYIHGHKIRPEQNDEIVERFLAVCGHTNFLAAKNNEEIIGYLKLLYSIRAMADPSSDMGSSTPYAPSITKTISPQEIAAMQAKSENGEIDEDQEIGPFAYTPVKVKTNRDERNSDTFTKLQGFNPVQGTLQIQYPIVTDCEDEITYNEVTWDNKFVETIHTIPTPEERLEKRTIEDASGKRVMQKTMKAGKKNGLRETYVWKLNGTRKMTVQREVAVTKEVERSQVVKNKWVKTEEKKTIEIENIRTKWGTRQENVLLYNQNTMNIVETDVMATIVMMAVVDDQSKKVQNKYNTHNKSQFIKDYTMEPVTQPQLEYFPKKEKIVSSCSYPTTKLDTNPVKWVDTEIVIEMQDVEIEVPNWELVPEKENSNEIPCIDLNSNKLVPVEYTSVHIDSDKVKQEKIQEIFWEKVVTVKKVTVPIKRETTTSTEVVLKDCTEVKIDESELDTLQSKIFKK